MTNVGLEIAASRKVQQARTRYQDALKSYRRKKRPDTQAEAYKKLCEAKDELHVAMSVKVPVQKQSKPSAPEAAHLSKKERKAARRRLDQSRVQRLASVLC